MIRSVKTAIHCVAYLYRATQWYASLLSRHPYFDELLYVGLEVD